MTWSTCFLALATTAATEGSVLKQGMAATIFGQAFSILTTAYLLLGDTLSPTLEIKKPLLIPLSLG